MWCLWKRGNLLPKGPNQGPPPQGATANLHTAHWSSRGATSPLISTIMQRPLPRGRTIQPPRGPSWTVAGSWNRSATTANVSAPGPQTPRRTTRGGRTTSWNGRGETSWSAAFLPCVTRSQSWKTTKRPPRWLSSKKPPPTSCPSKQKNTSSSQKRTYWGSGENSWNTNSNSFGTLVHELTSQRKGAWMARDFSLLTQGE